MSHLQDLKSFGIANRQRYLDNTDYCVLRDYEQNFTRPFNELNLWQSQLSQEFLDKRQRARDEITEIENATTEEEVENLTIEFE
jgi:hypothetical protein